MRRRYLRVREIRGSRIAGWLGVEAITVYPFILFCAAQPPAWAITHEHIHVAQVRKLGWLRFYASYLWQYARGRLRGLDHDAAYHAISYEAEAYAHQDDSGYPSTLLRTGPQRLAG